MPEPPTPAQPVLPELAQVAVDSSAPRRPLHIVYMWSYQDESMRFSGRGALRVEPPYKARTDLFGPRDETLMRSVVIGDQLETLPPNLPEGLLPPVSLSWATIGVLRPPAGAALELTRVNGDTLTIGYARGEEHWRFRLVNGRVRYAEWNGPGASRRTVEARGNAAFGLPAEVVYRDWAAFRELKTTLEEVNEASSFPPDTWVITGS
ncbi:MAG: hypothetical protein ACT443_07255 [Gemmatimonadota bacterium]